MAMEIDGYTGRSRYNLLSVNPTDQPGFRNIRIMPQGATLNPPKSTSPQVNVSATGIVKDTPEGRELDLLAVAIVLLRGWKKIAACAIVLAAIAAVLAFFVIRPTYTATAMFLPPHSAPGSGMAQLASELGSSSPLSMLSGGLKSPGAIYVGILGSRTIADQLIQQFHLQQVYRTKLLSETEKKLAANSNFTAGKDTLITISVRDHDPKRAAALANGYLADLAAENGRLALTGTAQRTLFFKKQMKQEEAALENAEVALQQTQEKTGIISPTDQARVLIGAAAQTRAQITALQVELSALEQSTTMQNPQVVRLKAEIASLQQQLQTQQNGQSSHQPGDTQPPMAKVPALEMEYVRKARQVKYHETLLGILAKQYAAAQLAESRNPPLLQVVDHAVVPDRKSGPHRMLLTAIGFLIGAFFGCLWVLWGRFSGSWRKVLAARHQA